MPGGDRTGPTGAGPMTGRGAGLCAGNQTPGYANPGFGRGGGGMGRGFGRGRGGGRGWRNMFNLTGLTGWQRAAEATPPPSAPAEPTSAPAPANRDAELAELKAQAQSAAATLEAIERRIDQLSPTPDAEPAE